MANKAQLKETEFGVGDTVRVNQKIVENEKERNYVFEGVVISIKGEGENKSFTVRRIAAGNIGVERIWPLESPWLNSIEVLKKGKVRRAKLYYLRKKVGRKATRVKTKESKPNAKKAEPSSQNKKAIGKQDKGETKKKIKAGRSRGKAGRQFPEK